MRSKSPELMNKIKKYAEEFYLQNGKSPSTAEIAEEVGVVKSTVYKYLVEMAEKNMIQYDGNEIITEFTKKFSRGLSKAEIISSVPFSDSKGKEEKIEGFVSLPKVLFGTGDFLIFRAIDKSMINAGIDCGDFVIARKQSSANKGDIVVTLIDDQITLKQYYYDDQTKKIILCSDNMGSEDNSVYDCRILGVVSNIIKSM